MPEFTKTTDVYVSIKDFVDACQADELSELIEVATRRLYRLGDDACDSIPYGIAPDIGQRELAATLSGVSLSRHALYVARERAGLPI